MFGRSTYLSPAARCSHARLADTATQVEVNAIAGAVPERVIDAQRGLVDIGLRGTHEFG